MLRFARRVRGADRVRVIGIYVPEHIRYPTHLTNEKDRGTYHGYIDVVDCAEVRCAVPWVLVPLLGD